MSAAHNIALRVATDLRHIQIENPGDQPQDVIHDNTVYRLLDAPYYAWLRCRMDRAKQAFEAGKMPQATWLTLRQRFNGIHGWAVSHIGEPALVQAIKTLDERSYLAPRHDHAIDLVESWD